MKTCKHCKNEFQAKRKDQIYCTSTCRIDANNQIIKEKYSAVKKKEIELRKAQSKLMKIESELNMYLSTSKTLRLITLEASIENDTVTYLGNTYVKYDKGTDYNEVAKLRIILMEGAIVYNPVKDEVIAIKNNTTSTAKIYVKYARQNRVK